MLTSEKRYYNNIDMLFFCFQKPPSVPMYNYNNIRGYSNTSAAVHGPRPTRAQRTLRSHGRTTEDVIRGPHKTIMISFSLVRSR